MQNNYIPNIDLSEIFSNDLNSDIAKQIAKQEAYKKTREGKLLIVLLKLHVLSNMRPDQANKYFLKLEKEIANYFIVFTLAC